MVDYKYLVEVGAARPAAGDFPAAGPEYRNVVAKDGPPVLEGVATLYDLFQHSVKKYAERPCLGSREVVDGQAGPYRFATYAAVARRVEHIASAMRAVGMPNNAKVGIYGANSPEWMITMQACNGSSFYTVPLYDSLGENAIEYIIRHAECSIVLVSAAKVKILAQTLKGLDKFVKVVVSWGSEPDSQTKELVAAAGMQYFSWKDFEALGAEKPVPFTPPAAGDPCTIMYTSGTTGDPKGVLIPHSAVVHTIASGNEFISKQMGITLREDDVFLSYLPLAHVLDRVVEELMLFLGASIGYWQGDIKLLVDDIGALKPTFFCGVPRVLERIYTGVLDKVNNSGFVTKWLFNFRFKRKLTRLVSGAAFDKASPIMDTLVFSKVKERLGGNVRLILSGGAPLSRPVEDFLKVAMCCPVVQGYGLTETCAASFVSMPHDPKQWGTVGPPQPVLSFRLEAIPEMNYDPLAVPARGEVCIKGPCLFQGYYKMEDKTKEVVDEEGWFHTGDVGEITAEGALRIIDRKKNIFKLSQGEYVAVEKVEEVYKNTPVIQQVWVYGNSFESSLVAVVVPNASRLQEWANQNSVTGSLAELCANEKAKKFVLESMTAVAKAGKLKGFEIVKRVFLEPEPWTPEGEVMTPTFKMKRPQLQKKYQAEIDAMYQAQKSSS